MNESLDFDLNKLPLVAPPIYRELAAAGAVKGAYVLSAGNDTGLVIVLRLENGNRLLGVQRAVRPRYFRSIDGAASVLQQAGITGWEARIDNDFTLRTVKHHRSAVRQKRKEAEI
jgi:hypothetical protein